MAAVVRSFSFLRQIGSEQCHRLGSVVPVLAGRMRNQLFPRQMAAYLGEAELRALKTQNTTLARDYTFGLEHPIKDTTSNSSMESSERAVGAQVNLLSVRVSSHVFFPPQHC